MNTLAAVGYPLFLVSATELFLGFLLLRRNRHRDPAVRSVALIAFFSSLFALSGGVAYVRASEGYDYDTFLRFCWVGWLAIPAALQLLYHVKEAPRAARLVGWILYPAMSAVLVLGIFTDLFEAGAESLIPFVDRTGLLENPARMVFGALMVWGVVLMFNVRRKLTGARRAQMAYFLLGLLIYAVCAVVSADILQLFGGLGFDPALASYFSLPFVGLTFYAITRYRLFDVQIVISRTMASLALFALLGALQVGLFRLLAPATGTTGAVLISLALIALLVFETPLSKRAYGLMDRLILRGKYDYQKILRESTRALVTILELEDLLKYIAGVIKQSLQVGDVCIFTREEGDVYRLRHGPPRRDTPTGDVVLADGALRMVQSSGRALIREEYDRQCALAGEPASAELEAVGAELVIPMFFQGEMNGAITAGPRSRGRPFLQSDIELLEALARQAAVAIENARLYEAAIRDSLTGLYHHRYFKNRLSEEVERAWRYDRPLTLLMVDIDRFKAANDEHGHQAGDDIIRGVARVILEGARMGDVVARYGGDEFAVLLPETNAETAADVADRLRASVEEMRVGSLEVTVSIGVASTENAMTDTELLEQADKALYRAKRNGKNRVELVA